MMVPQLSLVFDAALSEICVNYSGHMSKISPLPPGVTFLLGKNGTGKTSFINALKNFGIGEETNFPQVTFKFSLPTEDDFVDYLTSVDDLRKFSSYEQEVGQKYLDGVPYPEVERRFLNLPNHEAIVRAIWRPFNGVSFRIFNEDLNAQQVLELFGISEDEIRSFQERQDDLRENLDDPFNEPPSFNTVFRGDLFCEFLLLLLRRSTIWDSPHWLFYFPNEPLSSGPWLTDPNLRLLFVEAVREVFRNGDLIIVNLPDRERPTGGMCFSIPISSSEVVTRFCRARDEMLNEHRQKLLADQDFGIELTFPYDIIESGEGGICSSVPLEIPLRSPWDEPVFIEVIEIPAVMTATQIREKISGWLTWTLERIIDDHPSVALRFSATLVGASGAERILSEASEILADLDIGVNEIKISYLKQERFSRRHHGMDKHGLPTRPDLTFRTPSGDWVPLDHASDGQLSAISSVVTVLSSAFIHDHESQRAGFRLVVSDEFDRHLHATTADRLLGHLHEITRRANISLLVSTHSVPLLQSATLQSCRRLISSRDALGRLEIHENLFRESMVLADHLGTDQLRARSLRSLHIVVEGDLDVPIIEEVLDDPRISRADLEIVTLDGIRNLERDWVSLLRFLTSPILVVYDKQSVDFEKVWHQEVHVDPRRWSEQFELRLLHEKHFRRRKDRKWERGDEELGSLLSLAMTVLKGEVDPDIESQARRLHFFGLEVDDLVDYLSIEYFKADLDGLGVPKNHTSWDSLRADLGRMSGEAFKSQFGITVKKVEWVLKKMRENDEVLTSDRLAQLRAWVIGFLERGTDPRLG